MNYNVPLDFLVSPIDKFDLTQYDTHSLVDKKGNVFSKNKNHGYWDFLPGSSPLYDRQQWDSFQKLIENFVVSYQKDPTKNVSYDARPDALKFGAFCNYQGNVLDIGSGPHKLPSYIRFRKNEEANYYGVDILEGEQPKELNFVRAMGEHLPFRNNLFDITISGTSILHYINPMEGIREALRVTKSEGKMCIWLGVKSPEAPLPKKSPEWYQELQVPEGAENPFHYKRYAEEEFEKMIQNAGGRVADKETHPVDKWRKNIFYEVKKEIPTF